MPCAEGEASASVLVTEDELRGVDEAEAVGVRVPAGLGLGSREALASSLALPEALDASELLPRADLEAMEVGELPKGPLGDAAVEALGGAWVYVEQSVALLLVEAEAHAVPVAQSVGRAEVLVKIDCDARDENEASSGDAVVLLESWAVTVGSSGDEENTGDGVKAKEVLGGTEKHEVAVEELDTAIEADSWPVGVSLSDWLPEAVGSPLPLALAQELADRVLLLLLHEVGLALEKAEKEGLLLSLDTALRVCNTDVLLQEVTVPVKEGISELLPTRDTVAAGEGEALALLTRDNVEAALAEVLVEGQPEAERDAALVVEAQRVVEGVAEDVEESEGVSVALLEPLLLGRAVRVEVAVPQDDKEGEKVPLPLALIPKLCESTLVTLVRALALEVGE